MVWSTYSSFPHSKCHRLILPTSRVNFFKYNSSEKFLGTRSFGPGAAGWEARTLPMCYAAPKKTTKFLPQLRTGADLATGSGLTVRTWDIDILLSTHTVVTFVFRVRSFHCGHKSNKSRCFVCPEVSSSRFGSTSASPSISCRQTNDD